MEKTEEKRIDKEYEDSLNKHIDGIMKAHPEYPDRELVKQLISLIFEKLEVGYWMVAPEAKFKDDLKADSLDMYELVYAVEEDAGIIIPDEIGSRFSTVDDAILYVLNPEKFLWIYRVMYEAKPGIPDMFSDSERKFPIGKFDKSDFVWKVLKIVADVAEEINPDIDFSEISDDVKLKDIWIIRTVDCENLVGVLNKELLMKTPVNGDTEVFSLVDILWKRGE